MSFVWLPAVHAQQSGDDSTPKDCVTPQCSVAVDRSDPMHLLASASIGVRMSRDGGVTWTSAAIADTIRYASLNPWDSNTAYAQATQHQLFRSGDGGATWSYVGIVPADIRDLTYDVERAGHVVLVSDSALHRSTDGGATWVAVTQNASASFVALATADVSVTSPLPTVNYLLMAPFTALFHVKNEGPETASGVQLTIQLPTVLSVRSVNMSAQTPCMIGATTAVCDIGSLSADQTSSVFVNFQVGGSSTPAVVTATVSSTSIDPGSANNTASVTGTFVPPPPPTPTPTPAPSPTPSAEGNYGSGRGGGGLDGMALLLWIAFWSCQRIQRRAASWSVRTRV